MMKLKKYGILLVVTFILTVVVLAIVGNMLPVGFVGRLVKTAIFVVIGLVVYFPIEKKFGKN